MRSGWRAGHYIPTFTSDEEAIVEKAARRLAGACGYGSAWRTSVVHHSPDVFAEGNVCRSEVLSVAHRGHITETAARRGKWTPTHVRRQHAWTMHAGIVAMPFTTPDPSGYAALSCANLKPWQQDLLTAYALEDIQAWYRVEPQVMAYSSLTTAMAARDAMARLMYGAAATPIDARAVQVRMRASAYRRETRRAEWALRGWLAQAAGIFNKASPHRSVAMGASQGNGMRATTWWNPNEVRKRRNVNAKLIGTDLHPANDINLRDARSSAKDERLSRSDPRTDRTDLLAA